MVMIAAVMAWCSGGERGGGWCLITAFGGVFVGGTTSPAFRYPRSLVLPTPSTATTSPRPLPHHDHGRAIMAKDDYATSGGPLRLKGSAGVVKHKSKKKTKSSKLSKSEEIARKEPKEPLEADEPDGPSAPTNKLGKETYQRKQTEAERKFEEARKKKVTWLLLENIMGSGVLTSGIPYSSTSSC